MKIYTYWDSTVNAPKNQAALMSLWDRSWAARGWEPRILTQANARKHPLFKQAVQLIHNTLMVDLVMEDVRGGHYADPWIINFDLHPPERRLKLPRKYMPIIVLRGEPYDAKDLHQCRLVNFEGYTPDEILNCGRSL